MSDEITLSYLQSTLTAAETHASEGEYAKALQLIEPLTSDALLPQVRGIDSQLVNILKDRVNRYRVEGNKAGNEALDAFNQALMTQFVFDAPDLVKNTYKDDDFMMRWVAAAESAFKTQREKLDSILASYAKSIPNALETESYGQARYALEQQVKRYKKEWADAAVIYQAKRQLVDLGEREKNRDIARGSLIGEYTQILERVITYISNTVTTPELETLRLTLSNIRETKGLEANIYTSALQAGNYNLEINRLKDYPNDYEIDRYDEKGNYTGKIEVKKAREELEAKAHIWANEEKAPEYLQAAEQALAEHRPREALVQVVENRAKLDRFLEKDTQSTFDARKAEANAQLAKLRESEAAVQKSREYLAKGNFREAWAQYGAARNAFEWLEELIDLKSDITSLAVEGINALETEARTAYENSRPRSNGVTQVGKLLNKATENYSKVDDSTVLERLKEFSTFHLETTKHSERVEQARKDLKEAETAFKNKEFTKANSRLEALVTAYKPVVLEDISTEIAQLTTKVDGAINIGKVQQKLKDLLIVDNLDDITTALGAARELKDNSLAPMIKALEDHKRFIEAQGLLAIGQIESALNAFQDIAKLAGHPDQSQAAQRVALITRQRTFDAQIKNTLTQLQAQVTHDAAKVYREASILTPQDTDVTRLKAEVVEVAREKWLNKIETDLLQAHTNNRGLETLTQPKFEFSLINGHLEALKTELNPDRYDYWWGILGARVEAAQARSEEKSQAWDLAVKSWDRAIELASPDVIPAYNQAKIEAEIKRIIARTASVSDTFKKNTPDVPMIVSALIGDINVLMEKIPGQTELGLCLAQASIWAAFHVEKLDTNRANLVTDGGDLRSQLFSTASLFANDARDKLKNQPVFKKTVDEVYSQAEIGRRISDPMGRIHNAISTLNSVKVVGEAVNLWEKNVKPEKDKFPQLLTWWDSLVGPAKSRLQAKLNPDEDIPHENLAQLGMLVVLENDLDSANQGVYTKRLVNGLSTLYTEFETEKNRLERFFRTADSPRYNASDAVNVIKAQRDDLQSAIQKFHAVAQLADHFDKNSVFTNYRHRFKKLNDDVIVMVNNLTELSDSLSGIQQEFSASLNVDTESLLNRLKTLEITWNDNGTTHRALRLARASIEKKGKELDDAEKTLENIRGLLKQENYIQLDSLMTDQVISMVKKITSEKYQDPVNSRQMIDTLEALRDVVKIRAGEHRRLIQYLSEVGADGILNKNIILRGKSSRQSNLDAPPSPEREATGERAILKTRRPIPWGSTLAQDPKPRIQTLLDDGDFMGVHNEVKKVIGGYENDPTYRSLNATIEMLENPQHELGLALDSVDGMTIEARYKAARELLNSEVARTVLDALQTEHLQLMIDRQSDAKAMLERANENKSKLEKAWKDWIRANQEIAKFFEEAGGLNTNIRNKVDVIRKSLKDADDARHKALQAVPNENHPIHAEMNGLWIYQQAKRKVGAGD